MTKKLKDPRKLLVEIVKIIDKLKIPYLITGGIAVLIWGKPRFTADIDIVIQLKEKNIKKLKEGLLKLSKEGYLDEEAIKEAIRSKTEFNFIDPITGIKIDFWIYKEEDEFDKERFKRRVPIKIFNQKLSFTSPEDLILIKLNWYKISPSERQIEDIRSILKFSKDKINFDYLKHWSQKLSTFNILKTILQQ
ncbi:MAG: hypothetical protein KatS3mg095_0720 [Candidatus Parcubacteria bacterium]|nr:MAG: hypothetical protein KatS3mg095_0720 [Candidatus Parcubacteria bacterium]